ncbi:MAG: hypothetical protein AAB444_03145 [Patescibacteria group bacterium]
MPQQEATLENLTTTVNELKELSLHIVEHMATKEDLSALRAETKEDLQREIGSLRTELKTEIFELRTDMENNFSQVKTEMRLGFEDVKAEFEQVHKEIEILDKRTLEDTNALAKDVLQLKTQLSGA